jgi:hypothetical protein
LSVCNAGHARILKFTAVQLLNRSSEIRSRFKLDEAFTVRIAVGFRVDDIKAGLTGKVFQILPAGIIGKSSDLHSMRRAAGPGSTVALMVVAAASFTVARAAGKLDSETLTHKIGSMESWDDITGIHGILVLDETKPIHELDLCDLTGAMGCKVSLDIGLGSIFGQVAQVKTGRRHLGHDCCSGWFLVPECTGWTVLEEDARKGSVLRVGLRASSCAKANSTLGGLCGWPVDWVFAHLARETGRERANIRRPNAVY